MTAFEQDEKRLLRENAAPDRRLDPPRYVLEVQRTLDCTDVPGMAGVPGAETYILNVMDNLLAEDAELRQRYGKPTVRDCIDARRFVRIMRDRDRHMMGEPPPMPAPPPGPPPGQAPPRPPR